MELIGWEPAIRDCREAAGVVRAAEFGSETIRFLRPRTLGLFRTRAPISVQLYRAAREGRLVWHGPRSFAMLSRPADRAPAGRGRLLGWIDHQWSAVVLVFAFVVFVGAAFAVVPLSPVIGPVASRLVLEILFLLFLLVVLADYAAQFLGAVGRGVRALIRGRPRPGQITAETLPYEEWTMRLCHHDDEQDAADLLAAVNRRLVALAGPDAALACPRDGITTTAMRVRVAGWADGLNTGDPEISVRTPRRRPVRRHRIADTGSFFFLWLAGMAAALLASASTVAHWERDACAGACEGRPATFLTATEWIAYRLMWQEPPNLTAATFFARTTGLMAEFLLLFTVVVAVASGVRCARYRRQLRVEHIERMDEAYGRERVLLLVATTVERDAVLNQVAVEPELDFDGGHPVYRLGVIGRAEVLLAQVGDGTTSPASGTYSVPELLAAWQPGHVIMLGVCFGLRADRQRLGDVIVAEQLQVAGGDRVTAGHRLIERFRVAVPPPGVRVWPGLLLSWDVPVASAALRDSLKARHRDAEGGEREGAAVYASSVRVGTEWIVVKGICDWGADTNPDALSVAATNAARLVLDLIAARAFAAREVR